MSQIWRASWQLHGYSLIFDIWPNEWFSWNISKGYEIDRNRLRMKITYRQDSGRVFGWVDSSLVKLHQNIVVVTGWLTRSHSNNAWRMQRTYLISFLVVYHPVYFCLLVMLQCSWIAENGSRLNVSSGGQTFRVITHIGLSWLARYTILSLVLTKLLLAEE